MPFLGVDSWRWQYFAGQPCPDDVVVPIDDATAWDLHVEHRAIYNKLTICDSQGLPNGPHGTTPPRFPVFSKPIYNMRGMGTGSRVIATAEEYEASVQPGHMWMKLLKGPHVSTDIALAREQGVPPYVIFHDATLMDMVRRRPRSLAELGQIPGVGRSKLERYGETFLKVITEQA